MAGLKGLKGYKQEVDKSKRWLEDDFVAAGRNDGVVARIPDFAGGFIALPPSPTPLVDAVVEFFQMADERDIWIQEIRRFIDLQADIRVDDVEVNFR